MSQQLPIGSRKSIASGFVVFGEKDQEEGRGGLFEHSRWTLEEEAIEAAKGIGVFGSSGHVYFYTCYLYEYGAIAEEKTKIYGKRQSPAGYIEDGYLDFRDLSFGTVIGLEDDEVSAFPLQILREYIQTDSVSPDSLRWRDKSLEDSPWEVFRNAKRWMESL